MPRRPDRCVQPARPAALPHLRLGRRRQVDADRPAAVRRRARSSTTSSSARKADSRKHGTTGDDIDFALLVDGLEAEREQGITIDVAYRLFRHPAALLHRRRHARPRAIHPQHGDRRLERRPRHPPGRCPQGRADADAAAFADLLAARHPPRRAGGQQDRPGRLRARRVRPDRRRLTPRSPRSSASASIVPIPISARYGDNVDRALSRNTPWYRGPALLEHLETIDVERGRGRQPFRFPVQWVNRPNLDFRGYRGHRRRAAASRPGDPVVVAGSRRASRVTRDRDRSTASSTRATAGDAVTLSSPTRSTSPAATCSSHPAATAGGRRPVRRASDLDERRADCCRAAPT